MMKTVRKVLSSNDLGFTGGHQGGICVPKAIVALDFFPVLDSSLYNPRVEIKAEYQGCIFRFSYIYYNNRLHGKGTRNEYRLTGMTKFLRDNDCEIGDTLKFIREDDRYRIEIIRKEADLDEYEDMPLVIRASWYIEMEA